MGTITTGDVQFVVDFSWTKDLIPDDLIEAIIISFLQNDDSVIFDVTEGMLDPTDEKGRDRELSELYEIIEQFYNRIHCNLHFIKAKINTFHYYLEDVTIKGRGVWILTFNK